MGTRRLDNVVRHIRRTVAARQPREIPDRELLERFVSRRDEGAFAAIVKQHGSLVLGVCRRILRNDHDAEAPIKCEVNWSTYTIARINVILHGLEADIRGGKSTVTDPQFLKSDGGLDRFDVVLANFPFSDDHWWLAPEQQTEEQIKKAKKAFSKEGFKDRYHRFTFGTPPASYGDYAYIQGWKDSQRRRAAACRWGVPSAWAAIEDCRCGSLRFVSVTQQ
jgi:hypothetical protein